MTDVILTPQLGDVLICQTADDGEVSVEGGVMAMTGGLESAAYLSLFGGNEQDSGLPDDARTWWGNTNETTASRRYVSETQHLLRSIPPVTKNLLRIQKAVETDLSWFVSEGVASELRVAVSVPTVNTVKIVVNIVANGDDIAFEFVENWKVSL
jgi:phage gp46-like protein